jgi:RelE-like toxin of type II toxin-antitoxin system HigB
MLDYAEALGDLASPPGNRLEALRGDLAGLHSIRINDHGGSSSTGAKQVRPTSTSATTTEESH